MHVLLFSLIEWCFFCLSRENRTRRTLICTWSVTSDLFPKMGESFIYLPGSIIIRTSGHQHTNDARELHRTWLFGKSWTAESDRSPFSRGLSGLGQTLFGMRQLSSVVHLCWGRRRWGFPLLPTTWVLGSIAQSTVHSKNTYVFCLS